MIPFYTQGQNCPFSSWQSKGFEIYPKNSKVVPANFPSLPFIYSSGRLSHPKSAECLCRSPLCITRYGEAKTDKRRPARAVPYRSFGTPKQHGIPRHVSDRQDVSPSFAVLPTVSFHSGPAVAGANGDTSDSMTGRDPARRSFCLSPNRKSHPCVCPGRPLPDPPGRTSILPLLHTFYTHPVYPLIPSPECFFLLGNAVRICRTQRSVIVS